MLELYQGAIPTEEIYKRWEDVAREHNFGACCVFCGVVRSENGNSGLSFDIYEPILQKWFNGWRVRAEQQRAIVCMAHSIGDVLNGESSYMSAILSPNRKAGLEMYAEFVEDFKHNAPIWKYDLYQGQRIYAKERSFALRGSGILGE